MFDSEMSITTNVCSKSEKAQRFQQEFPHGNSMPQTWRPLTGSLHQRPAPTRCGCLEYHTAAPAPAYCPL